MGARTNCRTWPGRMAVPGPSAFLSDTGSQNTVISTRVAETMALKPTARAKLISVIGTEMVDPVQLEPNDLCPARLHGAGRVLAGPPHVPFIGRDQGFTVSNPGSIGPRRFQLPIVFGLLRIADGAMTLQHVSCETGERWQP